MRGVLIGLGVLLILAGAALAGATYSGLDLSFLSASPSAQEFLTSPRALYAGGGAAGVGLLLLILGAATGGGKKRKTAPPPAAKTPAKRDALAPQPAAATPQPAAPSPAPQPAPVPQAPPEPASAAPSIAPEPAAPPQPGAKPQASAHPPASAQAVAAGAGAPTWTQDPRLQNRRRVSDLVSINDALKAYHARHGAYPRAEGLEGYPQRGAAWIPGLSPDFIAELPRDPSLSDDPRAPQYVYASDGQDYKLLAQGVRLMGGTDVEVLGVRIDPTRSPTIEKADFGFWTAGFEKA